MIGIAAAAVLHFWIVAPFMWVTQEAERARLDSQIAMDTRAALIDGEAELALDDDAAEGRP